MHVTSQTMLSIAGGDAPLTPANVSALLTEASRLTECWRNTTSLGWRQQLAADVKALVRRLDPLDPDVATFDAWLAERGIDPSRDQT